MVVLWYGDHYEGTTENEDNGNIGGNLNRCVNRFTILPQVLIS